MNKNILIGGLSVLVVLSAAAGLFFFRSGESARIIAQPDGEVGETITGAVSRDVPDDATLPKEESEEPPSPEPVPAKQEAAVKSEEEPAVRKKQAITDSPVTEPTEEKKTSVDLVIKERLMDSGFTRSASRKIDTIVIHSSYDALGSEPYSISGIIKEYADYGVSAHYLVGRDGTAYRLVSEKDIAYHAGVSTMADGRGNVNAFSIGIEMVGTKESGYSDAQYSALRKLIADIKGRHAIKYIVGHSDIAPDRKTDPWKFDWKRLSR